MTDQDFNLLRITDDDYMDEMQNLAINYAYEATKLAKAKHHMDQTKYDLEFITARAYSSIRADLGNAGKVTEKMVENLVIQRDEVLSVKNRLNDATQDYNERKAIVTALEIKRDMLIQLSSNKRAEVKLHAN